MLKSAMYAEKYKSLEPPMPMYPSSLSTDREHSALQHMC